MGVLTTCKRRVAEIKGEGEVREGEGRVCWERGGEGQWSTKDGDEGGKQRKKRGTARRLGGLAAGRQSGVRRHLGRQAGSPQQIQAVARNVRCY